jgi:hypothetical protein
MSTNPDDFLSSLDVQDTEEMVIEAPDTEAPAAEAAPETPPEPTPDRARDAQTGQFVPQPPKDMPDPVKAAEAPKEERQVLPLAAHLEERRAWRKSEEAKDEQIRQLNERLTRLEKPAEVAAPEPDFIEDPKAYIDAKVGQVAETAKAIEQRAEALTQEQQVGRLVEALGSIESEFVKQTPDYYEALAQVREARSTQLSMLFPEATADQIRQTINREELQLGAQLLSQGRDPAATMYEQAKRVYGFRPKSAQPAPIPAPPASTRPTGDPSATLGSSGGTAADGQLEELDGGDDETPEGVLKQLRGRFQR